MDNRSDLSFSHTTAEWLNRPECCLRGEGFYVCREIVALISTMAAHGLNGPISLSKTILVSSFEDSDQPRLTSIAPSIPVGACFDREVKHRVKSMHPVLMEKNVRYSLLSAGCVAQS
jgi:hypothetical protein